MITVPDEIKELLHQDHCQKNIRIHFPNGERSDICNDLIVKDSVSFTESLCSQNTLKFGLCESPVFECEVVGVGNVTGATIDIHCEVYCDASVTGAVYQPDLNAYVYPIPYGQFVIESAKRQADMIHRKIQAYGFLSHVENTNEYIKLKNECLMNSAVPYEPNLLGTFLMLARAKGKISGISYTELEPVTRINYTQKFYEWTTLTAAHIYGMWGNVYDLTAYVTDPSKVVLVEYDGISLDQISQQLMAAGFGYMTDSQISIDEREKALKQMRFPGIYYGDDGGLWGVEARILASDECNYVYPYAAFEVQGQSGDVYLSVPQGGTYFFSPYAPPLTPSVGHYNLSDRHVKVYVADLSGYPEALYFARDIYTSRTVEFPPNPPDVLYGYTYDSTNIDYVKSFQSELETKGVFGTLKKDNTFALINIKQQFALNPDTDLYPGTSVFPLGVTGGKLLPQDYQSCWYDDDYTLPYGAISCSYKNYNNEDCEYILYMGGFNEESDKSTYQIYDLKDNDYIKGSIWTEVEIQAICNTIANNLIGVRYMPVEFVGRGLPYVEAGDTFEILTKSNDSITTIVLNRTLSGEQTLTDSYKSV